MYTKMTRNNEKLRLGCVEHVLDIDKISQIATHTCTHVNSCKHT